MGVATAGDTVDDAVGSEVMGNVAGLVLGSQLVGEIGGDAVQAEVVGEITGEAVGCCGVVWAAVGRWGEWALVIVDKSVPFL